MGNKPETDARADQHARFLETARQLGCDDDEAAFDEKLKAVMGPKTKSEKIEPTKD